MSSACTVDFMVLTNSKFRGTTNLSDDVPDGVFLNYRREFSSITRLNEPIPILECIYTRINTKKPFGL